MKISSIKCALAAAAMLAGLAHSASAALIAGVDFENGSGGFSNAVDDLDLTDGISVSATFSGTGNDTGANADTAYEGNFVGRFDRRVDNTQTAFWSITIPDTVVLDLDQITFAVRAATTGSGRDVQFRTSLDSIGSYLYENLNLPGRTATPNWAGAPVPVINFSDAKYKGLTNTTIDFIWISPAGGVDIDAVVLSGTIVPEPGCLMLLSLCLPLLARRRRR